MEAMIDEDREAEIRRKTSPGCQTAFCEIRAAESSGFILGLTNIRQNVLPLRQDLIPWALTYGVPLRRFGDARPLSVIPGLDPGTSRRRRTGGLQPEVQMSPAQLLKGDTRIKSGYDGKGGDITGVSRGNALS